MRPTSLLIVTTLVVGTIGVGALAVDAARRPAPAVARASTVLDDATVVRRCLPQLTRTPEPGEFPDRVAPLSPATVQVAKPLLNHRAGDLVSFVGVRGSGVHREWTRLDRVCRVPDRTPAGAPGSAPLPRSSVAPSVDHPRRNAQRCTEATDGTATPDDSYNPVQVVVPDERGAELKASVWRGRRGIVLMSDRNDGFVVLCDFSTSTPYVAVVAPRTAPSRLSYVNGTVTDRYWVAGATPTYGDHRRLRARTIVVTPPHRDPTRCPVVRRWVAGTAYGFYACVVDFPRVTTTMGEEYTRVEVLDRTGAAIWRGRWLVGIEGH